MARSKADEATRQLAWGDLRAFLKVSKERGEVQVIRNADPHLEMGALYELSLRKKYPPVLLFEDIKGYPKNYRVLTNVRTSRLLVGALDLEAVQDIRRRRQRGEQKSIPPELVNDGPVLENVQRDDGVNILQFPAPHWHPHDGESILGQNA